MALGLPQTDAGTLSVKGLDAILDTLRDKQALALGPGLGTEPGTRELVRELLAKSEVPLVIDADGLNCLADDPSILNTAKSPVILTPHPGEMARLAGISPAEVQADRMTVGLSFAEKHEVILVLKGAQTLVCCPDGEVFICPTGNPGMASGGMGDTLTGIIAGLLAQGLSPDTAALAGTFIHGLCGDILAEETPMGFLASDIVAVIPTALAELAR
tara:strand:- start:65 stop:709 length:645 start_codon:yes stop_codon:yes gene_type:complete